MELAIVILVCVFGTGTLFGISIIIFNDRMSERQPQVQKPAPLHTVIPQSNLEAFLRKPVITVRHKQIRSKPKVPKPLLERAGILHVPPNIPNNGANVQEQRGYF